MGQLCLSLKLGTSRNPCVYGTNSPGIAICWEPYVLGYRGYRTMNTVVALSKAMQRVGLEIVCLRHALS